MSLKIVSGAGIYLTVKSSARAVLLISGSMKHLIGFISDEKTKEL